VLFNHVELVILVVDVLCNKLRNCTGDPRRCSAEKKFDEVWRYNARRMYGDILLWIVHKGRTIVRTYEPLLIIA